MLYKCSVSPVFNLSFACKCYLNLRYPLVSLGYFRNFGYGKRSIRDLWGQVSKCLIVRHVFDTGTTPVKYV